MAEKKKWVQHLWWIGLYIFWIMIFQQRAFSITRTAAVEFCYLIFIAANFYLNIYYAIPVFLYRKKYGRYATVLLAGIAIAALLRVPLATYLNQHYFLVGKPQPGFSKLFTDSLLNIFIWVICMVAVKLIADRFRFQQHVDEMAQQKEQAELDFLNAQLNPHFLFNSINSIYGHIDKSNTTARNMLLTFSDMLRYQLYDCNNNVISIEKEINYIRNYVALQKVRKDDSLVTELNIADNVHSFSIAPLLFIAFIENSFKYAGTGEETENKVVVTLKKENDVLHFSCYNTKEPGFVNHIEHKGIGIANATRRLALIYPGRHELNIRDEEHFYEVHLKIQIA
ncbi:sensor histidine kinase [Chitinophagaceae bacterium MMS25-I14]